MIINQGPRLEFKVKLEDHIYDIQGGKYQPKQHFYKHVYTS